MILEELYESIWKILDDHDGWNDEKKIGAIEALMNFTEYVLKFKIGDADE